MRGISKVTVAVVTGLLVLFPLVPAQAGPSPAWVRTAGAWLSDVASVPGGDIAVVGQRSDGSMLVRVYGVGGALRWGRVWRPIRKAIARPVAFPHAVAVAPDGSVYVGGTVSPSCEGGAWFLRRYGPDGGLRWHREGFGWRQCKVSNGIFSIAADHLGAIVALNDVGCCADPTAEGRIRAFGPGGRVRWTSPFEVPGIAVERFDMVRDVAFDRAGNIYAVGRVSRTAEVGLRHFDRETVVQKLTAGGHPVWTRVFDAGYEFEEAITVAVRGTRVMVGGADGGSSGDRSWLRQMTTAGTLQRFWSWWGHGVTGVAVAPDYATYAVMGALVRRLAPGGALVWTTRVSSGTGMHTWLAGVAADPLGASVVGQQGDDRREAGRLWRFRARG